MISWAPDRCTAAAALLVALLFAGCGSSDPPSASEDTTPTDLGTAPDAPDTDYSGAALLPPAPLTAGFTAVWAEFMSPAEAAAALPRLREHGLGLNMAWPHSAASDSALYDLARDGEAAGVEVRPWLLLADSDGYWPGSTNAELFAALARQVMDRFDAEGLRPTWIIVDMELRIDRALELQALLAGSEELDIAAVLGFFQEGVDRDQYAAAVATYQGLVAEAHTRGWSVLLTTLPNVLDDYADGDDSLRQALGTPIDDIDWDLMTFQAYSTLLRDLFAPVLDGKSMTSFVVYDYAQTALELFGQRAGLDIGLTGSGVSQGPTFESAADLRADLEAGYAAGIGPERINVYNLEGILARDNPDAWLAPPVADPEAPPPDEGTATVRALIKALDAAN